MFPAETPERVQDIMNTDYKFVVMCRRSDLHVKVCIS